MKFGKEAASKIYSAKGSLPADKDIRDITSMIFVDEVRVKLLCRSDKTLGALCH